LRGLSADELYEVLTEVGMKPVAKHKVKKALNNWLGDLQQRRWRRRC